MSSILEEAIARARQLPDPDRDAIGSMILEEIDSERRWDELFARPESVAILSELADQALADFDAGRTRQLNLNDL